MTLTASHLQSSDHQRAGSTRAIVAANQLEQSVLDLETGLRGYLLAGSSSRRRPVASSAWVAPRRAVLTG